jgi:putative nucleotidyltransferase with HDIG domain
MHRGMISTTAELEDLVDGTVSIPTIPTIQTEINGVFASPDGSAKDAARVIEKDAAIATRVLRLVNSSFYALKNPVSNINLACSIVGLKVIKNVVVQATVLQTFGGIASVGGFDAGALWDHSFKTAIACRLLAERVPAAAAGLAKDDAYTCGLIHDIGKLILLDSQADRFLGALRLSAASGVPLASAESAVFGFDHAHVGGLLAQRWKLPQAVQAAVRYHHGEAPADADRARGALVRAANTFAHAAASPAPGWSGDLCRDDELQALGLSRAQHAEILATARTASIAG